MKYSTQAFLFRNKVQKPCDPFMDIATEKFSHLVMVGSTITMLLDGDENVEMTNDRCDWTSAGASLARVHESAVLGAQRRHCGCQKPFIHEQRTATT